MVDTLDFKPIFVGRETEQRVFSSTLDEISQKLRSSNWQFWLPPKTASRDRVFLIYGEGGIGKSTLLNRFAELTQNFKSTISLIQIDWEHEHKLGSLPTDFEEFIKLLYRNILASQPKNSTKAFRDFQKIIENRQELLKQINNKYRPEARKEFDLLVSTIAGPLGKATQAATGIPSDGAEKAISETAHQLSSGLAKFEDFFLKWLRNNLPVDEQNLYFSSAELYSAKFSTGLIKLTRAIPMVIAFDTYEWIIPIPNLDEKIRSLLILPLLKATNRIAFVVSGRHDLSVDYRRSFEGTTLLRVFPVLPFDTDMEIRQYLIESRLSENLKDTVANKTMGIPQAVATLTSIIKQSKGDAEVDDSSAFLISASDESRVVDETTLRFLRYCYENIGDSPEIAQQKKLDRQKIFALTLLRRYDLGALVQCWDVIGGKQLGSATEVNRDLVELRQRYSFVFDQGRDRMHELVKQFTRKFLRNQMYSDQGFIDRNLIQQLAQRLDEYYDVIRKQHNAFSKSLAIQYNDVGWLGATLDLIYSRYWHDEEAAWELVAKTYLEAITFNKTWLRNLVNLINDHQLANSRSIHLFVSGIEAALSKDVSDEIERDLISFIARQSHWGFSNTHKALICLRQAILFHRGDQETKALEKLLEALAFIPEAETELKTSVLDELVSVGSWLMVKQEYESAEFAFSQILAADKDRLEIRGLLIMTLLPQSKFDEAEKYLEGFDEKESEQLLIARSQLYMAQGRVVEGSLAYKTALRLNPNIMDNLFDELSDPKFFDFFRELMMGFLLSIDSKMMQTEARIMESITTSEELREWLKLTNYLMAIEVPTPEDSLNFSESLVNLFPNNGYAKLSLSQSQIAAKRYKEATNTATQLLALDPVIASRANLLLGKIKIMQKRPKEALVFFRKSLELDANNVESKTQTLNTLQLLNRVDEALSHANQIVEEGTEDSDLRWVIGEILYKVGQQEKGTEQFRYALKLEPQRLDRMYEGLSKMPQALRNYYLVKMLPAEAKFVSYLEPDLFALFWKQTFKAQIMGEHIEIDEETWRRFAESIARKVKNNADDLAVLGNFYEMAKQYAQAEKTYKQVIEIDPKNPVTYQDLADVYIALNQQEAAIPLLIKSAELKPRAAPYLALAKIYEKKELAKEALNAYQKAIELEPNNASATNSLASYYDNQSNIADAITTYTRAISLEPQSGYLYRNRANQYIKSKQLENAQADLEIAKKLEPNASFLYLRYAEFYNCKREFDKVEENALKAIEINEEFTNAMFLLALAQLVQKKTLDSLDTDRLAFPKADESDLKDAKEKLNDVIQEIGQISGADIVLNMLDNALADLNKKKGASIE